jgi:hypothetical protein
MDVRIDGTSGHNQTRRIVNLNKRTKQNKTKQTKLMLTIKTSDEEINQKQNKTINTSAQEHIWTQQEEETNQKQTKQINTSEHNNKKKKKKKK